MTFCDGGCNEWFHWKCIRERMGREQLSVAMRHKGLWVCDVCKDGEGMEEGFGAPVQDMCGGQAAAPAVAVSEMEKDVFRDRAQDEVERRRLMAEGEEEEELIDLGVALDSSISVFELLIERGMRKGQDVVSWVDNALIRFRRVSSVKANF